MKTQHTVTQPAFHYKAKVWRVLDGDTVECVVDLGFNVHKRVMLRLKDVNAPELDSKDPSLKLRAEQCKQDLDDMLRHYDYDVFVTTEFKRSFARYVGTLYTPLGTCVNEHISFFT